MPLAGQLLLATLVDTGGIHINIAGTHQKYIAISYCWGEDKTARYHIQCNAIAHAVPLEAYRALYRIRDASRDLYVWIDSLCINQLDNEERAKQVAMMCRIYQEAKQVSVYLGETLARSMSSCRNTIDAATFLLDLLDDYYVGHPYLFHDAAVENEDTRAEDRIDDMKYGAQLCEHHAAFMERGLHDIIEIKWFRRMWIKQEIWASRSIRVHYGALEIAWGALKAWKELYYSTLEHIIPPANAAKISQPARRLEEYLRPLEPGYPTAHVEVQKTDSPNPFLDPENDRDIIQVHNMADVGHANCSDPRDRIYALLAMSTLGTFESAKPSETSFHIDYDEPAASTFTRLAEYIIRRDGSIFLVLLNDAFPRPIGAGNVEGKDLPSWVPDWRFDLGVAPRPKGDDNDLLRHSKARVSPSIQIQDALLYVSGHHVGSISSGLEPQFLDEMFLDAWINTVSAIRGRDDATTHWKAKDSIFILEGTRWPVVLRPRGRMSFTYTYIGPLFLRGALCAYTTSDLVEKYLKQSRVLYIGLV